VSFIKTLQGHPLTGDPEGALKTYRTISIFNEQPGEPSSHPQKSSSRIPCRQAWLIHSCPFSGTKNPSGRFRSFRLTLGLSDLR